MKIFESFDEYYNHQKMLDFNAVNTGGNKSDFTVGFGRHLMNKLLSALETDEFDYLNDVFTSDEVAFAVGKAFKKTQRSLV